jgi:hypothetical protein
MSDSSTSRPSTDTNWLARLGRLAQDVDHGLPSSATADAIRAIVGEMYSAQRRAVVLSNLTGGCPGGHAH